MIYSIYLVGQITEDLITYKWREEVEAEFVDYDNVEIVNPCNCLFNKMVFNEANRIKTTLGKIAYKSKAAPLLPVRDKAFVREADIIIANMNTYTNSKPIIGSFFELAWAFEESDKVVIGVFSGSPANDIICGHPFVDQAVSLWTDDHIEACDIIKDLIV